MEEELVLVDENDQAIGVSDKSWTHLTGALHRAFSIFVFDSLGQMLIQKRSNTKYHSGGLWSNTCCGHPKPGESIDTASKRRLVEEMGIECELTPIFKFLYKARLDNGLCEHEYDHVLVGRFDGAVLPNRAEVEDWKWVDPFAIRVDVLDNPNNYTYWFRISLEELLRKCPNL